MALEPLFYFLIVKSFMFLITEIRATKGWRFRDGIDRLYLICRSLIRFYDISPNR